MLFLSVVLGLTLPELVALLLLKERCALVVLPKLLRVRNRANYWGSKVQSRAWKYPSRAVEAGDVVTGAPEWPLEALGEVMLDVGGSIGASTVNKIRNQEGLADQIVNLAEQIKTDHSPQQKIAASVDMVDERVFQALVDQNEDIENVKAARDVVYNVAYLKYLERNIKSAEEAADGNAQAEAEAHDEMTGSQTAPKTKSAWDAIRARSQQQAEEANAIVDEMIAMEEEQEQQKRDAEAAQEIQRAWVRYREDYLKQNADAWKQFREDYSPFYAQLAESSTAAREMMANDFARGEDPVQTLYDYVYEQETEGLDRTKDLPAARYRTHARLRKMLGDELYAKYYPDKKSPAERVADAHAETDRIIDEGGESETESATETGSDQTQARGGDQTTDSSAEKTSGTEEGGAPAETQTGTDGDEQTDRDSGEQRSEPTPTDTEGRAAIDAERQAMSEAEGDEDIVRWQHQDGTWEDTPVQYKLVERRSAVASHRLTDDGVSYEQNPTYNWEMDIQRRTDARGEEILDRSRDENRNMRLLTERGQDMSRGAPTLLPSYDAAGGNHRLMMLELIYNRDGDGKQEYLEALEKDLPNFGIDPAALEGFEEPVLVRQVLGELDDPAAFAEASNQPNAAPRTTAHQAQQDADALTPEIIDKFDFGEVGGSNRRTIADMMAQPSKRNHDALLAFIENLPPQARARYRRGDTTRLAPEARHYLENAFFAAMFDTERGAALYEMKENGTFVPNQNYTALMIALPHIVKLDAFLRNYRPDVHKLAISDDVAAAFHSISSLRGEPTNMTVGQLGAHLDTQPFADDPSITTEAHMIMKAIYASQSQRLISDLLVGYVANAINTIQASGVPVAEQDPLFEGGEVYQGPNKEKILATTIEEGDNTERG